MSRMQQSRPRQGKGQIICSIGVGFVLNTVLVLDSVWGCGHYLRRNQSRRSNPDCSAQTKKVDLPVSNTNSLAGLQRILQRQRKPHWEAIPWATTCVGLTAYMSITAAVLSFASSHASFDHFWIPHVGQLPRHWSRASGLLGLARRAKDLSSSPCLVHFAWFAAGAFPPAVFLGEAFAVLDGLGGVLPGLLLLLGEGFARASEFEVDALAPSSSSSSVAAATASGIVGLALLRGSFAVLPSTSSLTSTLPLALSVALSMPHFCGGHPCRPWSLLAQPAMDCPDKG